MVGHFQIESLILVAAATNEDMDVSFHCALFNQPVEHAGALEEEPTADRLVATLECLPSSSS